MIDKEYENFSTSEDKMFSFQSKLAAYRKETKAQMEAEMNTKVNARVRSRAVFCDDLLKWRAFSFPFY